MNAIKTLVIAALLAAGGIGLYVKINNLPDPQPPPGFSNTWGTPPQIEVEGSDLSLGLPPVAGSSSRPGAMPAPSGVSGGAAAVPGFAPRTPGAGGPQTTMQMMPPAEGQAPPLMPKTDSLAPPGIEPTSMGPAAPETTVGGSPAPSPAPLTATPTAPLTARSTADRYQSTSPDDTPMAPMGPTGSAEVPQGARKSLKETSQEVQRALDRGNLAEALLLLTPWYADPSLSTEQSHGLAELLGRLAGSVIYSREHHLEPAHVVREGETLAGIAAEWNVPEELVANVNGVPVAGRLEPGQELKVVRGPFSAVVHVDRKEMVLMVGGRYAGRFPIGVGRERSEVAGEFVVKNKMPNPPYFGRDESIDADDPRNPLGEHWLGLVDPSSGASSGPFAIHGTNDPASLDRDDPRGYIRLAPRDANDAFEILSVGSKVIIRR